MNKKNIMILVLFFFIAGVLSGVGCTSPSESLSVSTESLKDPVLGENPYPVSTAYSASISESAYPLTINDGEMTQGPEFNINEPVKNGDSIVNGVGPTSVPIILINLSQIDLVIGETVIDENGHFQFELENKLTSGEVLGIQLGDIANTGLNPNDFVYNDNYFNRPYIGILFDIVIVQ